MTGDRDAPESVKRAIAPVTKSHGAVGRPNRVRGSLLHRVQTRRLPALPPARGSPARCLGLTEPPRKHYLDAFRL